MKTPRQILFEHHRHAESKLNRIRNASLPQPSEPFLIKLLSKLIIPSPRAWIGLAAAWGLVLFFHLSTMSLPSQPKSTVLAIAATQSIIEQRRELTELMQTFAKPAAPSPALPPRRSERRLEIAFT